MFDDFPKMLSYELISWYGLYKACGDHEALQDVLHKLEATQVEADKMLVEFRAKEAHAQEIVTQWHIIVWAYGADELNDAPLHEFVILDFLPGEEAYARAEHLVGGIRWAQPVRMGDGAPYIPSHIAVGTVRQIPNYPPSPQPFSAEIIRPEEAIGNCVCPESLGCFETGTQAAKAIKDLGIQIINIQEFDKRAAAF